MVREEIEKEYNRLAKKADARLRALESYQWDKNFKTSTKWAYAKAMRDIKSWGGKRRFQTSPKGLSDTELHMKIKDIEAFLEAPTSTKTGIIKVYKKRVETLNKKLNTNYTWQEFANFIQSDTYKKMDSLFGSNTILSVVSKTKKLNTKIIDEIEKDKKKREKFEKEFAPLERETIEKLKELGWYEQ